MRKIREILRQKWGLGRTHREVAGSLGVSVGTITETLTRAAVAGLDWSMVQALEDDGELEKRLYGERGPGRRPKPDCHWIHTELRRKGVTLSLLHLEYLETNPGGYQYTQFCETYRTWHKKRRLSMRQVHRAGEKMFVDYAGLKPHYVDASTGELIEVELFVAVLGASNYTFAEATRTQRGEDWIGSHQRAFRFFGGVPGATVCDQLKTGVVIPCRYEPGIQRTYAELAEHYGTVIVPARPAAPKDKAKVEAAVQVAERWILARLRHETFFSLGELNERIAELLDVLNNRVMRVYRASRRELFERLDRPALKSLAERPFVFGTWKTATVSIDYHVQAEGHYYSVSHTLLGEKVDVRVSSAIVEIFLRGRRVASHKRSFERGRHTTDRAHMPAAHRQHAEWSPSRFIRWAKKIGPGTADLVEALLTERPHPEQGYRSCLGILRLEKRYGRERLEVACARAFAVGARSFRHVDSILKHGLDRVSVEREKPFVSVDHENIRGAQYYQ